MAYYRGKKIIFSPQINYIGTDTEDATATAADIVEGKTAYARGEKLTGTKAEPSGNQDIASLTLYNVKDKATAQISASQRALIIPENIAEGVTILGVTGTHQGGGGSVDPDDIKSTVFSGTSGTMSCTEDNPSSLERLSELSVNGYTTIPLNAVIVSVRSLYTMNGYLRNDAVTPPIKTFGVNNTGVTYTTEDTGSEKRVNISLDMTKAPSWFVNDLSKGYTSGDIFTVLYVYIYYYLPL